MTSAELDMGGAGPAPRARSRKAALEALERLLRAHVALSEQRDPEGTYGLLRPAREDDVELIEAVFRHCGVPLPDTLRAIYRRTLGVGNPVSSTPVLAVPFLRAVLPDEGFGPPLVGLEVFERDLGVFRDELALERPPFLHLGHAAPLGLAVSRNGLWSLEDYQGQRELPPPESFNLVFEATFCTFVDQALLLWANDLAGGLLRGEALDLRMGARLEMTPIAVQEALAHLTAPRALSPRSWGDVRAIDNPELLRATRRADETTASEPLGSHLAVVGLPYVERADLVARIGPGDLLRLHPVEDNPYDPEAVEVWHDGEVPFRVGFVERKDAPRVRALPEGAPAWRLRVTDRSDRVLIAGLERAGEGEDLPDEQGRVDDGRAGEEIPGLFRGPAR